MMGPGGSSAPGADRLLIAAPMLVEALLLRSGVPGARVYKTGMGPRRARAAAAALLSEPGTRLLVVGFCGGLEDRSEPGEVIVADEVLRDPRPERPQQGRDRDRQGRDWDRQGHDRDRLRCSSPAELAAELGGRGLRIRRGTVVCVSRLVLGEQRGKLLEGGSIAVDMESLWLAPGAGSRPFDVIRVVLDSPNHELLRPAAALGAVRAGRALRRVATALREWSPGERALTGAGKYECEGSSDESSI
jgi:4-hydroxy-3-methylbut-2-enyl diphosphate reductase